MKDHLPECPVPEMQAEFGPMHPDDVESNCFCDRLKACESRVISRSMKLALSDRQLGYREGLSAAHEAVIGVHFVRSPGDYTQWIIRDAAVAAIGSLRGECQDRTENGTECAHENTWFDRSLCYCEPDGTMHTICSDCGKKHLRDDRWGDCG